MVRQLARYPFCCPTVSTDLHFPSPSCRTSDLKWASSSGVQRVFFRLLLLVSCECALLLVVGSGDGHVTLLMVGSRSARLAGVAPAASDSGDSGEMESSHWMVTAFAVRSLTLMPEPLAPKPAAAACAVCRALGRGSTPASCSSRLARRRLCTISEDCRCMSHSAGLAPSSGVISCCLRSSSVSSSYSPRGEGERARLPP
mmetsp:Transcript_50413/g.96307  ORF Transcript_50413/g.96307 Transcript_50413/m.96307 type:complete len:200 (+) Transcript_50413:252-851(+)